MIDAKPSNTKRIKSSETDPLRSDTLKKHSSSLNINRKLSAQRRRRKSSKSGSSIGSVVEKPSESTNVASKDETSTISSVITPENPKVNYQEEVIASFYSSMLNLVVEDWKPLEKKENDVNEVTVDLEGTKFDEDANTIECKDFKNLTNAELRDYDIVSVQGSQVSISKKHSSKKQSEGLSLNTSKISEKDKTIYKKPSGRLPTQEQEKDMLSKSDSFKTLSNIIEAKIEQVPSTTLDEEEVTIIFKSGAIYKGPTAQKRMHGYGEYYWSDGAYYKGQFKKGKIMGYGMLILPDLSYYFGDFCCGLFHGNGTMYIAGTSMVYSGSWKAGKKHGHGWLLYSQGNWYDGEWFENMRHGKGLRQYKYGVRYKGEWYRGQRSGFGSMLYANNDFYQGEWLNGQPDGFGEYVWNVHINDNLIFPTVNLYQGSWKDGMREGAGILNFGLKNGTTLAGIWHKNLKHGAGVMICGNGYFSEMNPLFQYDKPLHSNFDYSSVKNISSMAVHKKEPPPTSKSTSFSKHLLKKDLSEKLCGTKDFMKSIQKISQQVDWSSNSNIASDNIFKTIMENMNVKKENKVVHLDYKDFPNPPDQCNPIYIPMYAAAESLDLTYYVSLIMTKFCRGRCDKNKYRKNSSLKIGAQPNYIIFGKTQFFNCTCKSHEEVDKMSFVRTCSYCDKSVFSTEQEFMEFEDSKLRAAIIANYSELQKMYTYYAAITVDDASKVTFTPILIRMFLWQFYRDIGLVDYGYSLLELDNIIAKNPTSGIESEHCPFEKIFFWQFIQTIISVALHVCQSYPIVSKIKGEAILSTIFTAFIHEICMPNLGKRKEKYAPGEGPNAGKCLFEYKDLLPISSVYLLYKNFGEPHSVRTLLKNSCVKKGESVPCYYRSFPDEGLATVKYGKNIVPFAQAIIYLPDDDPLFSYVNDPVTPTDPFYQHLFIFRDLGPKKIVECIKSVCPNIAEEGVIINMEYQLTFIEFYDIILACAYAKVDKAKKEEAKMKRREEIMKLKTEGLYVGSSTTKPAPKSPKGKKSKEKKKSR